MKNSLLKTIVLSFGLSLVLCLPITGFIYGFFNCIDCSISITGIFERIFIGLVEAVLTTFTYGKPWENESGNTFIDLRIYVVLCFLLLFILTFLGSKVISKPKLN